MTRQLLRIPVPWGHQPRTPPDDPFAEMVADFAGRYRCLADFAWKARRPPEPCPIGRGGYCAWGVQDEAARYCMWIWVEQHPDGPDTVPEMARALGQSKERINSVCKAIFEKARLAAANLSLPQPT